MNKKIRKIIQVFFDHDELFKYKILRDGGKILTHMRRSCEDNKKKRLTQKFYDYVANTMMLDSIYNINEDYKWGL